MDIKLVNRLGMMGIAFIAIGDMILSPNMDALKIQEQVIMDMNDIAELEREVEKRKRGNEKELYFKGYTIKLK